MEAYKFMKYAHACDVLAEACKTHAVMRINEGGWDCLCRASLFDDVVEVWQVDNYVQIVWQASGMFVCDFCPCDECPDWWQKIKSVHEK